jgi:hypothetical protein
VAEGVDEKGFCEHEHGDVDAFFGLEEFVDEEEAQVGVGGEADDEGGGEDVEFLSVFGLGGEGKGGEEEEAEAGEGY